MVFSSLEFIFLFLPVFFLVYYLVPARRRNVILLAGSLIFYFVGCWQTRTPEHFILLLVSILVDFWLGLCIAKNGPMKKVLLIIGIVFHLAALCFFKYTNFVVSELNRLPGVDISFRILLPMGISFYTFQGLSYLVDVYRGKTKCEKSLMRYAIYISMFEQLIAGPIVTYNQIRPRLHRRSVSLENASRGLDTFIFGLGLKVLLANPLGKLFRQIGAIGYESISTPLAWIAILAFSLQLYLDFFGYSLMAAGLGRMLGFRIPKNFNFPYLSRSMTEFWRRWHITLGSWFREYVYIPLGGNRGGTAKTLRNLLIVWLLTGLWHGAGYNFLLWGLILFVIIAGEKFLWGKHLARHPVLGHLYMLLLIPLTWSVFAMDSLPNLGIFLLRLFPVGKIGFWSIFPGDWLKYLKLYYPFLIIGTLFCTGVPFRLYQSIRKPIIRKLILLAVFAGCVYCMYRGFDDPFLYSRF